MTSTLRANSGTIGGELPLDCAAIDQYSDALIRGERPDPETWLIARSLKAVPDHGMLSILRCVQILIRHRRELGPEFLASDSEHAVQASGTTATSDRSSLSGSTLDGEPLPKLLLDRHWLVAHDLEPIGFLDVKGGGMGTVALAWHTVMKREVVLKAAREEHLEQRFRREIQVHAKLGGHANIAVTRSPLRYGEIPVLVVDYIPGLSLRRWVKALGPMTWAEATDCVRQAALGLAHAHSLGVIHRDVKSANLLRCERDGVVSLIDWGLARDREGTSHDSGTLTQPGCLLGTPAYCPPEQANDPSDATPESDLYGLGCVWYELLTGAPPFHGTLSQLARDHASTPIPPLPSAIGVPEALERVLTRLLAKERTDRYASAEEFIEALDRAAAHQDSSPLIRRAWFGIAAAGLCLAGWEFWGTGASQSPHSPAELTVLGLKVELSDTSERPTRSGTLGQSTYHAYLGDQVSLSAILSREANCYLLSFRPDGRIDIWSPTDEAARPVPTDAPRYPVDGSVEAIDLNHGAGLQAFAVLASREPLPEFQAWLARNGPPPWRDAIAADPGVVWVYDGRRIVTLVPEGIAKTRGKGSPSRGARGTVYELSEWLKSRPGIDAVYVTAFAVRSSSP